MKVQKKASEMTPRELAAYIDQSVLKSEFTQEEIQKYIQEGVDFGCATVCVNPASLDIAAELTKGTDTKICVVCDFPFGLSTTESKVLQAKAYCKRGDIFELDIVANYGWIRSGMWEEVKEEIRAVCDVCHAYDTADGKAKVKGSGCIRSREHFLDLIDMGIDRMGIGYRSTPVVLGLKEE